MPEQFEVALKSILDYNFDLINGIVRERDLLTQYTPMCLVSYGSKIMSFFLSKKKKSCHLDF